MLSLIHLAFLAFAFFSVSTPSNHPEVLAKLRAACGGGVCAKLAGAAVTPLLAKQGECTLLLDDVR
ncbi:hypothetical protein FB45DRAFT_1038168 [Roridomyces roridus]|uniref:Secreted protein n=1 Tax=Roridomyces roridus TaxID=1738132 RepID=A0AAD7B4T7_9AGAR|nr:hypothetical protein FB45DRAFT_1038168 [Roridomyces roridus]